MNAAEKYLNNLKVKEPYILKLKKAIRKYGTQSEDGRITLELKTPLRMFQTYFSQKYYTYINALFLFNDNVFQICEIMKGTPDKEETVDNVDTLSPYEVYELTNGVLCLYPISHSAKKLHIPSSDEAEVVTITIDPIKHPIAYSNIVSDFINSGMTISEAMKVASEPIEMEMFYHSGNGLFLVEGESVGCTNIYSPYTKEEFKEEN